MDNDNVEDHEQEEVRPKKSNRHDGGVADLERVTDYAEEKEIHVNLSNVSARGGIWIGHAD